MLLVIGLDGATWDVAEPLIAAGRMPNLAALRREGTWGPLASTVPPATFPSWSTFATGVNPGRHGIFDFTRRVFGSYEVAFVNSTYRAAPSLWRRLSDEGKRVCVLGIPGTYPPEQINGCMVSGFDTPVTTRADASFIYPPELVSVVEDAGGFPFADFQEFRIGPGWHDMALDRLGRGIRIKTDLATDLMRRGQWDTFLLLFGESDTVAHHFWKFHDPASPRFEPGTERLSDAVNAIYERLDAAIGTLLEAGEAENVVVVSDHGFGGAGRKCVYLNRWLAEQGYQRRIATGGGGISSMMKSLALRLIPGELQARAFRLNGGRWAGRLESRSRFGGIAWDETTAFSEELNYFPSVWLNRKGREPQGTVAATDHRHVVDELCVALRQGLVDTETGLPIVRHAWRREELYDGPYVEYAPDIVLELELDAGYSYNCMPSASGHGSASFYAMARDEVGTGKLAGMSGSHRSDGLFVLNGSAVQALGRIDGACIADMAPTLLSLAGAAIPAGLDGRTIAAAAAASGSGAVAQPAADLGAPRPYTSAEESEIAARLEDLGYLG